VCFSPGEPALLTLTGEVDAATTTFLANELTAAITTGRPPRTLVLDLAGVGFLSAAGVGMLLAAQNQAAAGGIALRVAAGTASIVTRALRISGAHAVLDVYPTVFDALAAPDRDALLGFPPLPEPRRRVRLRMCTREAALSTGAHREVVRYAGIVVSRLENHRLVDETWIPVGPAPSPADDDTLAGAWHAALHWSRSAGT
jgi:anti-anti-sigma factor